MRVGRLGTTSWPGWLERDSKDACKVSICIGMRRGGYREQQAPVAGWVDLTHLLWAGTVCCGCGRSCRYLWC